MRQIKQQKSSAHLLQTIISGLLAFFVVDRLLKFAAILHFLHRTAPPVPECLPTVTLLQPLTRGASGLFANLRSRARLNYAGEVQQLLLCDAADQETQQLCQIYSEEFPQHFIQIILVDALSGQIASKIEKLQAGLPYARGEILCFVDDDLSLPTDTLDILLPELLQPGVGAVFGLACCTNWQNIWSSLMSLFVNTNALFSYIPLSYLTSPYTITGHCFALTKATFESINGFGQMQGRIDDDHELARRVRRAGLRCVQTPLIYTVNNELASLPAYLSQMKRWFVIPRQTMLPALTRSEQSITLVAGLGTLCPPLLAFLSLVNRKALRALAISLGLTAILQAFCETFYLHSQMPRRRWLLFPFVIVTTPIHILSILLADDEIEWRQQKMRVPRYNNKSDL